MDTLDFSDWRDADFYDLPSQTTIHSLAHLKTEKNTSKFLVSSMNCQFCSVEYQKGEKITPVMKSIQFSHLPMQGDAEMVAISVFERLPPKRGHVVGVTYVIAARKEKSEDGREYMRQRSPFKEEFRNEKKGPNYYSENPEHFEKLSFLGSYGASSPLTFHRRSSPDSYGGTSPTFFQFDKPTTPEQQETTPKSQAFNVYAAVDDDEDGRNRTEQLKLEVIAENCQSIPLMYIPFCLKNTVVKMKNGVTEPVFLISGSDHQIHLYSEEPGQSPCFKELPAKDFFPEFRDMKGIAETIEIARPDSSHRVTAIGFEEGPIEVYQVNLQSLEIISVWKTSMDAPITSLHFFTHRKLARVPPCFEHYVDENGPGGGREEVEDPDFTHLHLLMTVHLQPALVYRNVLNSGLSEALTLPDSNRFDSALCSLALDVDFDGEHEVIVGTYGQELLVYKFFTTMEKQVPVAQSQRDVSTSPPSGGRRLTVSGLSLTEESSKHRHKSEESNTAGKGQDQQRKVKSQEDLMSMLTGERGKDAGQAAGGKEAAAMELTTVLEPHYRLLWRRPFPCPIMALGSGDMMGDGVENLVVLTAFGIHILQPNIQKLMNLVTEWLKQMEFSVNAKDTGDEFHKLQLTVDTVQMAPAQTKAGFVDIREGEGLVFTYDKSTETGAKSFSTK